MMQVYIFAIGACFAIDGDTLNCGEEHVRLVNIDTPEKNEPGYFEAQSYLGQLVDGSRVHCIVKKREKYGRLLGECSADNVPSISNEMLRSGLAREYHGGRRRKAND